MFLLTDKFKDSFEFEGSVLNVDMSFDNVLRLFELFDDPLFKSYEKITIALEMLIVEYDLIKHLDFMEQFELYNYVLGEFLQLGKKDGEDEEDGDNKKIMDFKQDAGLIYVSFLSEYGIDLFKEQGKLHWYKFSELLSNLGDKTVFRKVVGYRSMEVPSTKEVSKEYREHVQKMKKAYSLEDPEDIKESMEDKLDSIASTFGGSIDERS